MKRDTGIDNLRDYYYGYNSSLGRHDTSLLGSFYSNFDSHIAPVDKLKKIYPVTNYSGTGTSAIDYVGCSLHKKFQTTVKWYRLFLVCVEQY